MLPAIRNSSSVLAPTAGTPVNRLFDRFFHDDPLFGPLMAAPAWPALPLSMWEDEQNVYVEIDIPGVTDKDIDVAVHDGTLVIRGERKSERKEGGYDLSLIHI